MGLKIGAVAKQAGVSTRSLRYYEQQGLIESRRSAGGQREYDDDIVERVLYLQQLYHAGLSSQAIRDVLPCRDTPTRLSSDGAYERLASERELMRRRLHDLERSLAALDRILEFNRAQRSTLPDRRSTCSR